MFAPELSEFSDRRLAHVELDLTTRRDGVEHLFRLLKVDSSSPRSLLMSHALGLYAKTVQLEQAGFMLAAIETQRDPAEPLGVEELKRIYFDHLAGCPAFLRKYGAASLERRFVVSMDLGPTVREALRELGRRMPGMTPHDILLKAFDRLAVALEIQSGGGVFTGTRHSVGYLEGDVFHLLPLPPTT